MAAAGGGSGNRGKGNMWTLDQTLDQPMDEEAGRLRDMYREKVTGGKLFRFWGLPIVTNLFCCVDLVERWHSYEYGSPTIPFCDLGVSPNWFFLCSFGRKVRFLCTTLL